MKTPFLDVTDEARCAARRLVGEARLAALACLAPGSGDPLASRVALATDITGDPTILVSRLSRHTGALMTDARASLLLGEAGRGDPLAHPRLSLRGRAEWIATDHPDHSRIRRRFLARRPDAALYVDFADFVFFRIGITQASFNAGFARAYELSRTDFCTEVSDDIGAAEKRVIAHMNEDHGDAVDAIAATMMANAGSGWRIVTVDRRGFEAVGPRDDGDPRVARIEFSEPVNEASDFRRAFAALASGTRSS